MTKRETASVAIAGAVALGVVLAGVAVRADGGRLGTHSAPFVGVVKPRADLPATLVALVVLAAAVVLARRLLRRPPAAAAFAALAGAGALAVGLAVNAMRAGPRSWWFMFDLGPHGEAVARHEILASLPAIGYGPRLLLDRFAELVPSQPPSFAGHPPGVPLLLAWTQIGSPEALAALCIGALALVTPATYALASSVGLDEPRARLAAVLALFSPALVLFGVSSTDALFALAGTLSAALLVARRRALRVAGCALFGLAAQLSWLLFAIPAWAAIVVLRRDGLRSAAVLAAGCALAGAIVMAALALGWGYDPWGTLRATEAVYRHGKAGIRPYEFWVLGSPTAYAVVAGLPVFAAVVVATARGAAPAVALAAVLAVAAVLGMTKAEVERIWLPFVPLACVAAATVLPPRRVTLVAALLATQAAAHELLFATLW